MSDISTLKVPDRLALTETTASDGEVFDLGEDGSKLRGSLERFLMLFGPALDEAKGLAEYLQYIIDVDTVDSDFLQVMGKLVGVDVDVLLPIPQQREQIRRAVPTYRRKGTLPGFVLAGFSTIGLTPVLNEFVFNIMWSNSVPWSDQIGVTKVAVDLAAGASASVDVYDTNGFEAGEQVLLQNSINERDYRTVVSVGIVDDQPYILFDDDIAIDLEEGDFVGEIVRDPAKFQEGVVRNRFGLSMPFFGPAPIYIGMPEDITGYSYGTTYFNWLRNYLCAITPTSSAMDLEVEGRYAGTQALDLDIETAWRAAVGVDLPQDLVFDLGQDVPVRFVRIKAGYGLKRFEIAYSDDDINYFFAEAFEYGTSRRINVHLEMVDSAEVAFLPGSGLTMTDPPPVYFVIDEFTEAGTLDTAVQGGSDTLPIVTTGVPTSAWILIVDGEHKEVHQVSEVGAAFLKVSVPIYGGFPMGSLVYALTVSQVDPGFVVDPIKGTVTGWPSELADRQVIMDGYVVDVPPFLLGWQLYRFANDAGAHRYWRLRIFSTWGADPEANTVNMSEIEWDRNFYTCDKLGVNFYPPCEVEEEDYCNAPVVECTCSPPIWIEVPAYVEKDSLYTFTAVMPYCDPCELPEGETDPYEYQFDWGDGSVSAWGDASQDHTYTSEADVIYISVRVRCKDDPDCVSVWYLQQLGPVVVEPA